VSIFLSAVMIVTSYLIGSVPIGLMFVWLTTGRDVRQVGSGRIGGANTLRAAGPWVALLTVLADLAKGFLSVWLARIVIGTQGIESPLVESLSGLMAVVGHNYPIFIRFKGGAGTMTTGGGALALWPWNAPILIPLGAGVIALTGHTSVGSITVAVLIPIIFARHRHDGPHLVGTAPQHQAAVGGARAARGYQKASSTQAGATARRGASKKEARFLYQPFQVMTTGKAGGLKCEPLKAVMLIRNSLWPKNVVL